MLTEINNQVRLLSSRVIPAWDGQSVVASSGNLYLGRITRSLRLQLPAPQLVVPDGEALQAFIVPKIVISDTPKEGFSGHVMIMDPASHLARSFEAIREETRLGEFDKTTAHRLASQAIAQHRLLPYLAFLGQSFGVHMLPEKLLERRAAQPRLGALYDHLNSGHPAPSASEAAQICSLSASRFSILFHDDLGMTYPNYCSYQRINRYMMQAAAAWRPVAYRAKGAGFHDISHLAQVFKRVVNVSLQDIHGIRFHEDESLLHADSAKAVA